MPLADELQFVRAYLELQQARFADRLTCAIAPGESQGVFWVPSLILQPLVENAVAHGLAGHQGPVEVRLTVVVSADRLILAVVNEVASGRPVGGTGIGLANVRERLAVQFPGRATLTAGMRDGRWASEISLPLVREPPQSVP